MSSKGENDFVAADLEFWKGLENAVARRQLFWVFYYAKQLSTAVITRQASRHLPVIEY